MNIEFDFTPQTTEDNADKGFICPCCGSFVKRYKRKLNSNMALVLIHLYRAGIKDFIHVEQFMSYKNLPRSGDFHKLVHWGLLDKKIAKRDDGSNRNGYYKLNDRSIEFVLGRYKCQEKAIIYNGKLEGFEGELITIKDALGDKFNYNELMYG